MVILTLLLFASFLTLNQRLNATPIPDNDSTNLSQATSTASADAAMNQIASLVKRGLLNEAEAQLEKLYAENLGSPSIHILRADLLTKLGRPAEARKALEIAYKFTPDNLEVLKRVAASRDTYADQAAEVYEKLAKKLENENADPSIVLEALNRGLVVALRDGESAMALRLSEKLRAHGRPTILQPSFSQDSHSGAMIGIPGGIKALAQMAGIQEPTTPDTFFIQYAERLVRLQDKTDFSESLPTFRGLHEYFKIIVKLQSLTGSGKEASKIRLDFHDKQSQEIREKILFSLGWQIKKQGNRRVIERDERQVLAYRKKVSEALGINDDALKVALESGKSFDVNVPTDLVPVQISENYWTTGLLNGSRTPGGLAEAFLDKLPAAYLYVALSKLNKETQIQIVQSFNPKTLLKEHWKTLYFYGSSLNIRGSQVEIPGGTKATKAWERLVGADHRKIGPFLNALLSKDDGRLMAFYYVLSGLPSVNQEFFTRNSRQLETLYKSFSSPGKSLPSPDIFLRRNTIFQDVAREMPLSGAGEVQFPGGSDVWKSTRSEAKRTDPIPSSGTPKDLKAKNTNPPLLIAAISNVGRTENIPFPSFDLLKRVEVSENNPFPSVERSKEREKQNNPFPTVDSLKKIDVQDNTPFPSINRLKNVDETESDPFPSVDGSKKGEEEQSSAFPSVDSTKRIDLPETPPRPPVNRLRKVEVGERDPFPSIDRLKRVEIKEITPVLTLNSTKKIDAQEGVPFPSAIDLKKVDVTGSNRFPSVNSIKKVDENESTPLPVTSEAHEREGQRESEIKILTEMFSTRDEAGIQPPTRLEAFLSIVRLEKHWGKTLDESSVTLLLENFIEHKQLFPYLDSLPPLERNQLQEFFNAVRNLDTLKSSDLALIVGDFQCFLKLLSLLYENGVIQESRVPSLLGNLCRQFATARTDAEFAKSSFLVLDSLKKSLQQTLGAKDNEKLPVRASGENRRTEPGTSANTTSNDIDELLFEAFGGASDVMRVKLDAGEIEVDLSRWKKERMREVMALQAIPPADLILKIFQQLHSLANESQDPTTHLQSVDTMVANLHDVDETLWESVPKDLRLNMIQLHREKILRSLSALKTSIARGESPKERENLAGKVIQELHSSLHLSLLGWIYAYHFSPNDLLIKEDPLFIRRHRFVASSSSGKSIWHDTDIDSLDPDSGSYIRGGVAQIAAVAGEIGLVTDQAGEVMGRDQRGARLAAAQLASLRAIPWRKWDSRQLHVFCTKVRLGKELLALASLDPEVLTGISEDLRVLVGPTRCRILLQGLPGSTSTESAGLLSSEELFELADGYWKKKGAAGWGKSPLADQLAREEPISNSESITWIGGYYPQSYGCGHAHLFPLGPYEEYENVKNPELISERLSHVLLDLAEKIDHLGLPLELLPLLAEPAVRQLAITKWMSDWSDWQAALKGLRELRLEPVISHLQENP